VLSFKRDEANFLFDIFSTGLRDLLQDTLGGIDIFLSEIIASKRLLISNFIRKLVD